MPTTAATEPTKPLSPRRSNEHDQHSQPDSDASYDLLVSGATSRAPGSPGEEKDKDREKEREKEKEKARKGKDVVTEESDEEDWE